VRLGGAVQSRFASRRHAGLHAASSDAMRDAAILAQHCLCIGHSGVDVRTIRALIRHAAQPTDQYMTYAPRLELATKSRERWNHLGLSGNVTPIRCSARAILTLGDTRQAPIEVKDLRRRRWCLTWAARCALADTRRDPFRFDGLVLSILAMLGPSSRSSSSRKVAWRALQASPRWRHRSLALLVASFPFGAVIPGLAGASSHTVAPATVAGKLGVCPDAGCTSGVTVDFSRLRSTLPGARSVTLCVANRCVRESGLRSESIAVRWRDTPALKMGPYNVLVLVRDQKHRVLLRLHRRVTLKRIQPNGANCPPTCFAAALVLNAKHRQLDLITHL
jgi:hypothetical protein